MRSNVYRQVSKQIIEARQEKKMSAKDLAKVAHTSLSWISRLENMNGVPTIAFLKRISSALGIKFQLSI